MDSQRTFFSLDDVTNAIFHDDYLKALRSRWFLPDHDIRKTFPKVMLNASQRSESQVGLFLGSNQESPKKKARLVIQPYLAFITSCKSPGKTDAALCHRKD